jgi:predicted Zn-dependent protease with MMP-like domain
MVKLGMRYRADLVYREVRRRQFERIVSRVVDSLSDELRSRLENVEIVVEDEPRQDQLSGSDDDLFGLYEGVPLTERTTAYGMTLPDKITIFRGPLERKYGTGPELVEQVWVTVLHEIAHYFGIDEERLVELGYE